jgi:hypothetical protein
MTFIYAENQNFAGGRGQTIMEVNFSTVLKVMHNDVDHVIWGLNTSFPSLQGSLV